MSLEAAFQRLSIRPSNICRQCRRSITSSARPRQQHQSATAAFAAQLQAMSKPKPPPRQLNPTTPTSSTSQDPPSGFGGLALASSIISDTAAAQKRAQADVEDHPDWDRKDLEKQVYRRWKVGDVYSPHDLSKEEAKKWKRLRRNRPKTFDAVDQLGINPLLHYKNFSMMSEFVSDMGRIMHRRETGLRPVNQRKMAKAIRRSVALGLMPSTFRHPEILKIELRNRKLM